MGMMLGDTGIWGNILLAAVFVLFGLHLMDLVTVPFLDSAVRPGFNKKGYWAAFLFGLVFGIGLGPCTFAFMAPVLAVAFTAGPKNILYSVSLVTAYAFGHCLLIVLAGTFTEVVEKYLRWSEDSKAVMLLKKACGIIMLIAAAYLIFKVI